MLTQRDFVEWYLANRQRSRALFDLLDPDAYFLKPIPLRNPVVFYEGHLPAFSTNTLLQKGLGRPPIDPHLDRLFARGIDPADEASARPRVPGAWPSRAEVADYGRQVDNAVVAALDSADFDPGDRRLTEMAYAILEHEAMHQETLCYMWHELAHRYKSPPPEGDPPAPAAGGAAATPRVRVAAGTATLGVAPTAIPFGWDNEFPACRVAVPAFEIDVHNVSNGDFMAFVEAGGYRERRWWSAEGWAWLQEKAIAHPHFWSHQGSGWAWRGMFALRDLPLDWPVFVSHAEAAAYARWKGARLPSEAQYQRAAHGAPGGEERRHPWGDAPPDARRGNFDFARWDPLPVGSCPAGASAWGVHDLVGNGWEWTTTPFAGHPGFAPMASYPEYSADFFDGQHYVLKGASPATAAALIRPTFRNWFRATYPYVYATFRTVGASDGAEG
ncbi:SUMF1/EgtB/PvdO family nonheme iron enzyme [Dechloromonas sp. H13]|uniref:SUMF1/EgtB/PvdO family nonheme iron enzyme n=1 Tax=Dechloromonas sp. H13 TaxID=2570193 RepID=UPI001290CBBB|nr:SUMF1/EgtB/PvdO family nonheme iron enzyme [Dechloromonas sp. H13]